MLITFELLFGLKINYHKSELFLYGQAKECLDKYTQIFGCDVGNLPFKYLGIPIHHKQLNISDCIGVGERFEKKLGCWQGKFLSIGARVILINSCLSSLPLYMLYFFHASKGVLKKNDFYRSRFLWQEDEGKKKISFD